MIIFSLALTDPTIVLTPPLSNEAGQNVTLVCHVTVVEGLIINPNVMWRKFDGNSMVDVTETNTLTIEQETEGANTTLTLRMSPIQYSDGAVYICSAETDLRRIIVGFAAYGAASSNYSFIVTSK